MCNYHGENNINLKSMIMMIVMIVKIINLKV
jgi:hypothetical protein